MHKTLKLQGEISYARFTFFYWSKFPMCERKCQISFVVLLSDILLLLGKKVWYALSCKYTNVLAFPIFIQWTAFIFENKLSLFSNLAFLGQKIIFHIRNLTNIILTLIFWCQQSKVFTEWKIEKNDTHLGINLFKR